MSVFEYFQNDLKGASIRRIMAFLVKVRPEPLVYFRVCMVRGNTYAPDRRDTEHRWRLARVVLVREMNYPFRQVQSILLNHFKCQYTGI
jgi:hypothetical protein